MTCEKVSKTQIVACPAMRGLWWPHQDCTALYHKFILYIEKAPEVSTNSTHFFPTCISLISPSLLSLSGSDQDAEELSLTHQMTDDHSRLY